MMRAMMRKKEEVKPTCVKIIYNGNTETPDTNKAFAVGKKEMTEGEFNNSPKFIIQRGHQYGGIIATKAPHKETLTLFDKTGDSIDSSDSNKGTYLKRIGNSEIFLFYLIGQGFTISESKSGVCDVKGEFKPVSEWK